MIGPHLWWQNHRQIVGLLRVGRTPKKPETDASNFRREKRGASATLSTSHMPKRRPAFCPLHGQTHWTKEAQRKKTRLWWIGEASSQGLNKEKGMGPNCNEVSLIQSAGKRWKETFGSSFLLYTERVPRHLTYVASIFKNIQKHLLYVPQN